MVGASSGAIGASGARRRPSKTRAVARTRRRRSPVASTSGAPGTVGGHDRGRRGRLRSRASSAGSLLRSSGRTRRVPDDGDDRRGDGPRHRESACSTGRSRGSGPSRHHPEAGPSIARGGALVAGRRWRGGRIGRGGDLSDSPRPGRSGPPTILEGDRARSRSSLIPPRRRGGEVRAVASASCDPGRFGRGLNETRPSQ